MLVGSGSEDPAAGLQPLVLREVRRGVLVGVWAHPLARRHANFFGKGVYFARDASYSTYPLYCEPDAKGSQTVFLVRVVTGEFCKGVKNALTPDLRNAAKNQLYDSTVDNVRDPSIFVTYHDAQAYPEYMRDPASTIDAARLTCPLAQDQIHAEKIKCPQRAPSG